MTDLDILELQLQDLKTDLKSIPQHFTTQA